MHFPHAGVSPFKGFTEQLQDKLIRKVNVSVLQGVEDVYLQLTARAACWLFWLSCYPPDPIVTPWNHQIMKLVFEDDASVPALNILANVRMTFCCEINDYLYNLWFLIYIKQMQKHPPDSTLALIQEYCVEINSFSFYVAKYAESTVSWRTAPSWWRWRWAASGPTGWWTTSLSGSTGTTSTTARCPAASSGTLPTASWAPSSLCPSWSPYWWRPWWCGGASVARGSCSQGRFPGEWAAPFVTKVCIWFTPSMAKETLQRFTGNHINGLGVRLR